MRVQPTDWRGRQRVDVTASLPNLQAGVLRRALLLAIGDEGATLREALGTWQGVAERAYTVERIDPPDGWVERIAAAAITAGCEAVQVERWNASGYSGEEWRDAHAPKDCPDCGHRTITVHADGSETCGRCFVKGRNAT